MTEPAPSNRTPFPLERLGPYRIGRKLGEGGMGAVYEAEHVELSKRVAVKVLRPALAGDPRTRERFVREGKAAGRIHHPHVVDVYDVGVTGDVSYLVMERLEGRDLAAILEAEGPLSVERLVSLMLPILSAISSAHSVGVIHRDLKPSNIFVAREPTGRERPVVLDFGISKLAFADTEAAPGLTTASAQMIGTVYYMAPEQARSAKYVGPASDQYSLGVMLYAGLTGVLPFVGESLYEVIYALQHATPEPPSVVRPAIPEALDAIILRALCRDQHQRFENVHALGCALWSFADPLTRALWAREFDETIPPSLRASNRQRAVVLAPTPGSEGGPHDATSHAPAGFVPAGGTVDALALDTGQNARPASATSDSDRNGPGRRPGLGAVDTQASVWLSSSSRRNAPVPPPAAAPRRRLFVASIGVVGAIALVLTARAVAFRPTATPPLVSASIAAPAVPPPAIADAAATSQSTPAVRPSSSLSAARPATPPAATRAAAARSAPLVAPRASSTAKPGEPARGSNGALILE